MSKVSLQRCDEYDCLTIKNKVAESFSHIGFDPSTLKGKLVAVKPNLLSATRVEQAVVTHPEVFRAVVQLVNEHGGTPVLIESPAVHSVHRVMKKTGYDRIAAQEGCRVADARRTATLHYAGGERYKSFEIISDLFEADFVLSLPKFKTHNLTYITGAVKNLFGFISGLDKSQWHLKAQTKAEFSGFLLDLYAALQNGFEKPKRFVHVMDAIVGMEGQGPGATGRPKKIGAVLTSTDAVAADAIATRLTGLDAAEADTLTQGERRRLGVASLDKIEVLGASPDEFRVPEFAAYRSNLPMNLVQWSMRLPVIRDLVIDKPVLLSQKCTLCLQCLEICPAGAISRSGGTGKTLLYDYHKCIRCFCCMEVCPEAAIELRRGPLQELLAR
jgi:uncharacterized protein (DUF362 family)/Pyruvate/2-oxoacid:ferredoxin oxidoreductase delta subunit